MRRERRTKEEWRAIFVAQQSSGITAREYCAKHNIHFKTFSARKSDIDKRSSQQTGKLVKVVKPKSAPVSAPAPLTIIYHGVTLNVGHTVEAEWLVDVIKALAS
jgi:hypothetical protein